jgi:DNA-binding CsgD family transcriptional regulator/PAS domain-containing protein
MDPLSFAATGVFFSSAIAGTVVFALRPTSPRNRAFFALSLLVAVWNLVSVFAYTANGRAEAEEWARVGVAICALTVPILLTYALVLRRGARWWIPAVFAFAVGFVFALRSLARGIVFDIVASDSGHWAFVPDFTSPWFAAWTLYIVVTIGLAVWALVRRSERHQANPDQKVLRSVGIVIASWLTLGAATDFLLAPKLGIPAVAQLLFALLIAQTAVMIARRHFLAETPGMLSRALLNNFSTGIALLDSEGRPLVANDAARRLLALAASPAEQEPVPLLRRRTGPLAAGFAEVASGREERAAAVAVLPAQSHRPVTVHFSRVHDQARGVLGVLVELELEPEMGHLLCARHVTKRECEVLELIASGQSCRKIAAELGISVRTVKAHVAGLYTKLDVTNRVELLNKLREGEPLVTPER